MGFPSFWADVQTIGTTLDLEIQIQCPAQKFIHLSERSWWSSSLVKNSMKAFWPLSNQWREVPKSSSVLFVSTKFNYIPFFEVQRPLWSGVVLSLLTSFFCCWSRRAGEWKAKLGPWDDVGKIESLAQPSLTLFWYNLSLKDYAEDLLVSLILVQDAKWIEWGAHLLPSPITKKSKFGHLQGEMQVCMQGELVLFVTKRERIPRIMSVTSGHGEWKGIWP